jgi:hypothetical protein
MRVYVSDEHIVQLLTLHPLFLYDENISKDANEHLVNCFPLRNWSTIVNWDEISHRELDWMSVSNDEAVEWASSTLAGRCSLGLLLYNPSQPCIAGSFRLVIDVLDQLIWKAPGPRVLFGVDRIADGKLCFSNGIIEYDGKGKLFANI